MNKQQREMYSVCQKVKGEIDNLECDPIFIKGVLYDRIDKASVIKSMTKIFTVLKDQIRGEI